MTHYGIVKRDIHEVFPDYYELIDDSYYRYVGLYSFVIDAKFESEYNFRNSNNRISYYVNCIDYYSKKSHEETFWEGEIAFNEFKIGDTITIGEEKVVINSLEKDISGKITYYVNPKYVKSENFDELYKECKDKYSANLGLLAEEYEDKYGDKEIVYKKTSIWRELFWN